jgi:catechol 2,3-dioxygenase-like lactoylglutathione lyase family enzyme
MRDPKNLFEDFDRGRISRRELMCLLGIAVATRPATAFAQGSCGGARAGTPECNPTPAKPPFEPTGWKTVLLDHFSVQVADYRKEAAYYAALMNWKVRSDDGTKAVLDIGDWAGIVIRGGYQPPPPAAPATPPAGGGAAGGGRGGGRGTPRNAVFDSFCWGIEPWDTRKVEAELKTRGLNPIADHQGNDFQSFHVKDPGGFGLQISNGNRRNRRRDPAKASLGVPPPFESTNWQSVYLDHISFEVADYKANVAFYEALLGWKSARDEGSQSNVQAGDMGELIIRGGNSLSPAWVPGSAAATRTSRIGHISFGLAGFDHVAVRAELEKRGLNARVDTGGAGDIETARYKSYHTTTPNGFDLQISNVTSRTQGGGG